MNPPLSTEAEKAKNSIATARAQRDAQPRTLKGSSQRQTRNMVTTSVDAGSLVNPPEPVTVPEPVTTPIPTRTLDIARNVSRDANGFIAAQTAEADRLKALQQQYADQGNQTSLTDMFNTTLADNGVNASSLKELKDIQLQLTDMDTASAVQETRIEGAAGQTQGQAMREVTQEQRENAVRTAGLAARAAVLQGNITTATALAKDAVDIAFKDRQDKATNLLNQIDMLQGRVDDQTAQLLEEEKRSYEAELASIEELKKNVSAAMVSGATASEVSQLNDPQLDDAAKLSLAQTIVARGANEQRNLEIQQKLASIRSSNASAQKTNMEIQALKQTQTGAGNVAVQALDSFSGALNENNRIQFTKALTGAVARGNVEQTEIALKNAAQAAAGSAMRDDVIKRDQAIGALRAVQKELAAYEAAGGDTNLLTGGYEDLQNKLGRTGDEKLASIETRINLALNAYTNAVSGASFTPQESARYESLFPSTSNTSQLNATKVNTLLDAFETNNQVFYGNFYGGYTPSQLAEKAVYDELVANATPEELKAAGITQ